MTSQVDLIVILAFLKNLKIKKKVRLAFVELLQKESQVYCVFAIPIFKMLFKPTPVIKICNKLYVSVYYFR